MPYRCHVRSFLYQCCSQATSRRRLLRSSLVVSSDSADDGNNLLHRHRRQAKPPKPITSALLTISYDGGHFSGWSAANHHHQQQEATSSSSSTKDAPRSSKRRQKRGVYALSNSGLQGKPRSVEGVLRFNLARLFGNVDPIDRVVVEGCSRTDKGVHANGMVALVYCLAANDDDSSNMDGPKSEAAEVVAAARRSIPGKRLPYPRNSTDDTCFQPMKMSVEKLGFTLNRMLPPDIRIMQAAEMPFLNIIDGNNTTPFHPSLSCSAKTYVYHLSFGAQPDLTTRRFTWHVGASPLDLVSMENAAKCLAGRHDFRAFRGAPRGASDKVKFELQTTTCNVMEIEIVQKEPLGLPSDSEFANRLSVILRGDRFLFKMARFLVGALVAVGSGSLNVQDVQQMLQTGQRHAQFECAPAHGLFLDSVEYNDSGLEIAWKSVGS